MHDYMLDQLVHFWSPLPCQKVSALQHDTGSVQPGRVRNLVSVGQAVAKFNLLNKRTTAQEIMGFLWTNST